MKILRWAGGKTRLLPQLLPYLDRFGVDERGLVEPFAGSLAVGFACKLGTLRAAADSCWPLVDTYKGVVEDPERVAVLLRNLTEDGRDNYYNVRDWFNARLRGGRAAVSDHPQLAAAFIYLNRAGFNGLYRVNKAGLFNVPVGRGLLSMPDEIDVLEAAETLRGVTFFDRYVQAMTWSAEQDSKPVVYLDPPFRGTFSAYGTEVFDDVDRKALALRAAQLAQQGHPVLLNETPCGANRSLYSPGNPKYAEFEVQRTISAGEKKKASVGLWIWEPRCSL